MAKSLPDFKSRSSSVVANVTTRSNVACHCCSMARRSTERDRVVDKRQHAQMFKQIIFGFRRVWIPRPWQWLTHIQQQVFRAAFGFGLEQVERVAA